MTKLGAKEKVVEKLGFTYFFCAQKSVAIKKMLRAFELKLDQIIDFKSIIGKNYSGIHKNIPVRQIEKSPQTNLKSRT